MAALMGKYTGLQAPWGIKTCMHVLCHYRFARKVMWLKVASTNSDPKVIARYLWLKVASTNSDPKVIARYFLECVEEVGGMTYSMYSYSDLLIFTKICTTWYNI